ncbi:hypothetical protein CMUST_13815 [Corynebacterium mustelae]|uniref:Bacterial sensory transduction regulator n=1 Tax=Corynebacterium mustelae TaxID=571915 RepID=A0A0G3H7A9_9CORY|nr:hypothetical protein [Corynebacterium mustelae]AKK07057.1 hypothetical protein CMUST_13815 [Corynebacterium mustelae]
MGLATITAQRLRDVAYALGGNISHDEAVTRIWFDTVVIECQYFEEQQVLDIHGIWRPLIRGPIQNEVIAAVHDYNRNYLEPDLIFEFEETHALIVGGRCALACASGLSDVQLADFMSQSIDFIRSAIAALEEEFPELIVMEER